MPSKPRLSAKKIIQLIGEGSCVLCRRKIKENGDALILGPCETTTRFSVHYFCLLFSSYLVQNGDDTEGIKGFLEADIKKELVRGNSLQCFHCRKLGATVGCVNQKCRRTYHFPCGLEKGIRPDFGSKAFETLCSEHRPPPRSYELTLEKHKRSCSICLFTIDESESPRSRIVCSSCHNPFHLNCMRQAALKSGLHHLRCPFCQEEKRFVRNCQANGIYVPDQDAAWEKDDAYADHYEDLRRCTLSVCLRPGENRQPIPNDPDWDIVICSSCGSNGVHRKCGKLKSKRKFELVCSDCCVRPLKGSTEFFFRNSELFKLFPKQNICKMTEPTNCMDEEIDIESFDDDKVVKAKNVSFEIWSSRTKKQDYLSDHLTSLAKKNRRLKRKATSPAIEHLISQPKKRIKRSRLQLLLDSLEDANMPPRKVRKI